MLNIVWPIFIIISFSYAIFSGNLENLNSSIFKSTEDAINLTLSLLGTICLWNGVIQDASKTSVIDRLMKLLNHIIKILFTELMMKTGSLHRNQVLLTEIMLIKFLGSQLNFIPEMKFLNMSFRQNLWFFPKKTKMVLSNFL